VILSKHELGGFGGHIGHDAHLLSTLSAVQVLVMLDALDRVDIDQIAECNESVYIYILSVLILYIDVSHLQDPVTGSFSGDEWGEVDTRFSFSALACLSLLGRLDRVDVNKAAEFVLACQNADGGFGSVPGAESHAGQSK
jgi:geranylgeranyl transferase type-2 subunit beta